MVKDKIYDQFLQKCGTRLLSSLLMNTMRILKKLNPGDMYYEAYLGHLERGGENFFDVYMLMWFLGSAAAPKRILEIGTRTGISLCQLLSSYVNPRVVERIVCIDLFNDGYISPNLVKRNLAYLNLPFEKVEFFTESSLDVLPRLKETFDYILVDGDHTKEVARQDLENSHQLLESGGFLLFDDISDAPGECALIDV